MIEATIPVGTADELVLLLGTSDQHLRRIRDSVPAKISARDDKIHVSGEETGRLSGDRDHRTAQDHRQPRRLRLARAGQPHHSSQVIGGLDERSHGAGRRDARPAAMIRPRTAGQAEYVEAIRDNDLVFCSGPAGTGKTYLAVATAVEALKQQQIGKIVLVRPAVEAGESLGFLPAICKPKSIRICGRCSTRSAR